MKTAAEKLNEAAEEAAQDHRGMIARQEDGPDSMDGIRAVFAYLDFKKGFEQGAAYAQSECETKLRDALKASTEEIAKAGEEIGALKMENAKLKQSQEVGEEFDEMAEQEAAMHFYAKMNCCPQDDRHSFVEGARWQWERDRAVIVLLKAQHLQTVAHYEEQIGALKEKLTMTEIKLRIAKDAQLRTYDGLADKADKFDRFKFYGTSDCKQCETGRITLFYHTDKCIECAPEDYK